MQAHELVAQFAAATHGAEPMDAARGVIEALRSDLDGVAEALGYLSGTGGNAYQAFTVLRL